MKELEQLLATEPAIDPPAELVPGVLALVQKDLARARRNARLALAGAIAALVLAAVGITFFDAPLAAGEPSRSILVRGALGLAQDALDLFRTARSFAPTPPELPALELPALGYGWAALAFALAIVAVEVRVLATRRAAA